MKKIIKRKKAKTIVGKQKWTAIVDDPAIMSKGLAYGKDTEYVLRFKADEVAQMIVGPALIPDIDIVKKMDNGELIAIYHTKEDIELFADDFLNQQFGNKFNFMHESGFEVSAIIKKSMIIKDEIDKNYIKMKYNYDVTIGTWWLEAFIENKEFFLKYVKNGYSSFSIESVFVLEDTGETYELHYSKEEHIEMVKENLNKIVDEIMSVFNNRNI